MNNQSQLVAFRRGLEFLKFSETDIKEQTNKLDELINYSLFERILKDNPQNHQEIFNDFENYMRNNYDKVRASAVLNEVVKDVMLKYLEVISADLDDSTKLQFRDIVFKK